MTGVARFHQVSLLGKHSSQNCQTIMRVAASRPTGTARASPYVSTFHSFPPISQALDGLFSRANARDRQGAAPLWTTKFQLFIVRPLMLRANAPFDGVF
jgi:hypothetical protein